MAPTNKQAETRTLVVMRHGHYLEAGGISRLTDDGHDEVAFVAGVLLAQYRGRRFRVLTSSAARAHHTGMVLCDTLGGSPQIVQWLSNANYPEDIRTACLPVLMHMAPDEVLVLVTHLPQVSDFAKTANVPNAKPYTEEIEL